MPRKGRSKGKKKSTGGAELGRTLVKRRERNAGQRFREQVAADGTGFHIADASAGHAQLVSVTESNSLEEFMANAIMAGRRFDADKEHMVIMNADGTTPIPGSLPGEATDRAAAAGTLADMNTPIRIPRRPKWTDFTNRDDLHKAELEAFLEWRRHISRLEASNESKVVTPFEKNLAIWKQLWRVMDRSDVVLQIVDARNPLMFWCPDLVEYAEELNPNKRSLLVLNKADLLTEELRLAWGRYLTSRGVDFLFFAAKKEQERLEEMHRTQHGGGGTLSAFEAALEASEKLAPEDDPREAAMRADAGGFDALADAGASDGEGEDDEDGEGGAGDGAAAGAAAGAGAGTGASAGAGAGADGGVAHVDASGSATPPPGSSPPPTAAAAAGAAAPSGDDMAERCRVLNREELVEYISREYSYLVHEDTGIEGAPKARRLPKPSSTAVAGDAVAAEAAVAAAKARDAAAPAKAADGGDAESDGADPGGVGAAGEGEGEVEDDRPPPLVVGMVGYPNVGKSSTINALLGVTAQNHLVKRVAVGATPGKTKHLQTLTLTDDIQLCDCPGLVFPSFVSTREEMVVNGVLPIDQMRQYTGPIALLCRRISRQTWQDTYNLRLPLKSRIPTVAELLDAYCTFKGIMGSSHGGPDHHRASRILLKDYVNGTLLYAHPPPGYTPGSGLKPAAPASAARGAAGDVGMLRKAGKSSIASATNVLRQEFVKRGAAGDAAGAGEGDVGGDAGASAGAGVGAGEAVEDVATSAVPATVDTSARDTAATAATAPSLAEASADPKLGEIIGDDAGLEFVDDADDDIDFDFAGEAGGGASSTASGPRPGGKAWKARNRLKKNRRPKRKGDREADPYGTATGAQFGGTAMVRDNSKEAPEAFVRAEFKGKAPRAMAHAGAAAAAAPPRPPGPP